MPIFSPRIDSAKPCYTSRRGRRTQKPLFFHYLAPVHRGVGIATSQSISSPNPPGDELHVLVKPERTRHRRLAALDRSQAVIEFDIGSKILAANKNFLDTVSATRWSRSAASITCIVRCGSQYQTGVACREFWAAL